ncbi:DedA family protein [Knoellia sp. p5-6-4]|uniref:DedA family protein n=1 Tax=unclassified Knoellia TaxID=2618719 RepID=UPI0023DC96A8|nr:DedA family protein [Knoellia sp. p5-6-4]MDF2143474.1 DedA family protein [Knoellia sp. p5-6-4]
MVDRHELLRARNGWLWVMLAVVLLLGGVVVARFLDGPELSERIAQASDSGAYLMVFALVFLDGLCALFPAETTLNTASTLAVEGALDLVPIMVAGALGAVGGDSALYWVARSSRRRFETKLDRALSNDKVAMALDLIGSRAAVMLAFGRYVPGLRFVVNASCGLSGLPYRTFLLWSAVGGTLWSVVSCTLAYAVASVLAGYPLASVVVAGGISSVAIAVIFLVLRSRRGAAAAEVE